MTYLTALLSGLALLFLVDVVGAILSRSLKFHYGFLALLSFSFALSPLALADPLISAAQTAIFSLIIYAPESLLGLFIAYRINPHAGRSDYRTAIDQAGFVASYATCLFMWFGLAGVVYLLKSV